ncbi:MAG: hypothetical protein PHX27_02845 [Candidatus ainarchaeum sp.]|nr:hypothetical protein [Candidatus ainarchaeum sp.]
MELLQGLFYGITLLGCFPIGYSLIRLILPQKQDSPLIDKIGYSYALGLIVFLPGMILALMVFEKLFFIITGIIYAIIFTIFFIKRKRDNLQDTIELTKEKIVEKIPQKILDEEERNENLAKNVFNKKPKIITPQETKKQLFKEKMPNVIEKLRENTLKIKEKKEYTDKEETLNRLKNFAKQINKKNRILEKETINKSKKEDIDEQELEEIGNVNLDDY